MKQIIRFSIITIGMVALMMWLTKCYFMAACIAVICAGVAWILAKKQSHMATLIFCATTALVCYGVEGWEVLPAVLNTFALVLFSKFVDPVALDAELEEK